MKMSASGVGRTGSVTEAVGRLHFYGAKGDEAQTLKILFETFDTLPLWAALIRGYSDGTLTETQKRMICRMIKRCLAKQSMKGLRN